MTTFYIPRPSQIYPNLDFWYEKKPSGNPALKLGNDAFQILLTFKKILLLLQIIPESTALSCGAVSRIEMAFCSHIRVAKFFLLLNTKTGKNIPNYYHTICPYDITKGRT
jgi:hypothetical protein